uniref:Nuclear pore complex protein Nup88 n=1 Tax=Phallusia mammillata TaxID=59560 RepID=A0A6F9DN14_9ASCI|nr:nuclear pore complex protein Nup88 [Phallusia mammillata]
MFGAQRLNELLAEHEVFQHVADKNDEADPKKTEQLLHIHGGNLFIWNNNKGCLLVTNLRSLLDESESGGIQTLMCQNPPYFKVRKIQFSPQGNHIALVGARGVSILALPPRWGRQAEYEGGKNCVTCKTFPIGERFFITNISVQLKQASWYPMATSPSPHICILTSDNVLRIYNIHSDPQTPIQTHKLTPPIDNNMSMNASRISLLSMYSVTTGLGETVIAFDFAPPMDYTPKRRTQFVKASEVVQLQPIYLLQGNGEVLMLSTSLTNNKFSKGQLQGPLIMLPSAEDNYGVDSCSIHIMSTTPTTVVIATSTGKLHHCIALWTSDNESDDIDVETQSVRSRLSQVRSTSPLDDLTPPTLYVYETVELEMDLTMEEDDPESHLIDLFGDPVLLSRYHCCTSVGIHSIALPWLNKMYKFLQEEDEDKDFPQDLTQDEPCIVEHILCTKTTPSSPPCLIKGFSITSDPLFGPSLVCLTADGQCTSIPLLSTHVTDPPPLLSAEAEPSAVTSPLKQITDSSFESHIRSLLKRNLSQPLIRAGDWNSASSERECLQLVTRATEILRDEYLLKQKLARDAISRRVSLLKDQKQQQLEDLDQLDTIRANIQTCAEEIAEDHEECKDRQEQLIARLEMVTKLVKDRDPVLSKAEMDMGKELKGINDKLQQVDNRIKQLRIKHEYQEKKIKQGSAQSMTNLTRNEEGTSASVQVDRFKHILFDEGDKIHEMIKKLNNLNVQAGI